MRKYKKADKLATSSASTKRQATLDETPPPKVTPKSLFRHENHTGVKQLMAEEKVVTGKGNDQNLGIYRKLLKAGFDGLSKEEKVVLEERAKAINEEIAETWRKPASDEKIIE